MASTILLIIHIAAGSIALLAAPVALTTAKGGDHHKRAGRAYVIAMTVVFLSALPLAILISSVFLLLIAVFSFYLVFAGWRFARNYRGQPQLVDWAATAILMLTGLGMWGYSISLRLAGNSQWVVMLIFGAIAVTVSLFHARFHWRPPVSSVRRISRHLNNMLGGTVATVTAVTVVNVDTNPPWLAWILPSIVMMPLSVWWTIRVTRRSRKQAARG